MPELTQAAVDEAERIRTRLSSAVSSTQSNADLTQEARLKKLAQLYSAADAQMATLRERFEGTSASTAQKVRVDIFGSTSTAGADAISVRDADDRVSRIERGTEALDLLQRAEENGDKVLARAIAQQAYARSKGIFGDQEWLAVLAAYVENHPDVANKLATLEAATRQDQSTAAMFAFVLPKPNELARFTDYRIALMGA